MYMAIIRPRLAGVVMSASTIWPPIMTSAVPAPATKRPAMNSA